MLSCNKILTYKLLGSQLWTALPLEVSKSRHIDNSRTKLRIQVSNDGKRDVIELYLHCKFQSLPFCVRRRNGVTDRKIAPKVQMPRWNDTIHHSTNTATADACIQEFCTAITMQCFSKAIRSQSVLTTN